VHLFFKRFSSLVIEEIVFPEVVNVVQKLFTGWLLSVVIGYPAAVITVIIRTSVRTLVTHNKVQKIGELRLANVTSGQYIVS
jgi:acyl-CoA hydrolase